MMEENGDQDLYFSFDEEPEEIGGPAGQPDQGQAPQNRTFLIAVIALGAITVLAIAAFVVFFLLNRGQPAVSPNELTNQANMTLLAETQAADALTQAALLATPTPLEPVEEVPPEEEPTATPTSLIGVTPIQPAEETPAAGAEATETPAAEVTEVAEAAGTPTQAAAPPTPTGSGIIEVTPLGGLGSETQVAGLATPAPGVGTAVTPQVGEITGPGGQPTAVATLPQTGFTGTAGLAGAGVLAVMLVIVAVAARRIRLGK